jgi:[NiFe] hydrogenase assembly HybE family chaperone
MTAAGALAARVGRLEAAFRTVQATRMAGVPVLNPRLAVQAVGFEPAADEPAVALGVLVTPWFMNLVRLPLAAAAEVAMAAPGHKVQRDVAAHSFEFIGAHEEASGGYEASSLYSPMFEFADQAVAVATARAVLALLRPAPAAPVVPAPGLPEPARRGFLFGRAAAGR